MCQFEAKHIPLLELMFSILKILLQPHLGGISGSNAVQQKSLTCHLPSPKVNIWWKVTHNKIIPKFVFPERCSSPGCPLVSPGEPLWSSDIQAAPCTTYVRITDCGDHCIFFKLPDVSNVQPNLRPSVLLCYVNCGSWMSVISATWELVSTADSQGHSTPAEFEPAF